eukprot:Selendium_serpulae@DN6022_c0_g1_i1.p1
MITTVMNVDRGSATPVVRKGLFFIHNNKNCKTCKKHSRRRVAKHAASIVRLGRHQLWSEGCAYDSLHFLRLSFRHEATEEGEAIAHEASFLLLSSFRSMTD